MASNARRARRQREQAREGGGAQIISLAEARHAAALAIADAARSAPEHGQRTPRPRIDRWTRTRFDDVDLARVTSILRKAEDGDTVELADLWLRMLKTDAHLLSVWESRTAPVAHARWEVTPAEAAPDLADAARRLARACAEMLGRIADLPTIFSAFLNARGVGFTVAEMCWTRGPLLGVEANVIGEIKPIHSRRFRFSDFFEIGLYDDGRAVGALREDGWPVTEITSRGSPLARLPAGKYVVHQPIGIHDYPTATGLVHSVARWWWVKQVVTKYWLSGAEIGANPRIIGEILQNAVGVTLDELHDQLESLAGDGVAVLREGSKITIHDSKAKASSDVWDTLFRRMDLAMSKAVLGSTLNVEIDSSGGNRAAAESQDNVTIRPRQQQDAAQMWSSIQRDAFRFVRDYNPHLFPPSTPLPLGRSVLVEERSVIDQLAIDSGAVRVDELRASRGLPLIGGEEGARFIAPITRDVSAAQITDAAPAPVETVEPDAPEVEAAPAAEPSAPEALEVEAGENVQQAALNGAQVDSLLGIVERYMAGTLPRAVAIELIVTAFPVERAQAERLVPEDAPRTTPADPAPTGAPLP